jgi:hypothetical protein
MKMTSNASQTLNFNKKNGKVRDGVPETVHLDPGATDDLDVDPNDPAFRGCVLAGAITVPASVAEKAEAAAAAPAGGKSR